MHRAILAAAAAVLLLPAAAHAATPSTSGPTDATLTGDAAAETLTVSQQGALLTWAADGSVPSIDWDPITVGDQTVAAAGTVVTVHALSGDDTVNVFSTDLASGVLDGDAGDDLLNGSPKADTIDGGGGDDRIDPGGGVDQVVGDTGNDQFVWNSGDNSDTFAGDVGADLVQVNGDPVQGDVFSAEPADADPDSDKVRFDRTNLTTFHIDIDTTERLTVNGQGGADTTSFVDGLAGRILTTVNGGTGADTIGGTDAGDLLTGGDGIDTFTGGAGDDRISGDRDNDTMNGGDGSDTLVWNNGDNNDQANGDAGFDTTEINAAAGGDEITVAPDGARTRIDRTNLIPFMVSSDTETLEINALSGNDTVALSDDISAAVAVWGGSGSDTLTGANGNESLAGGDAKDTITGGTGSDLLDGDAGDDTINGRDGARDLVRCGAGNDTVDLDDAPTDTTLDCEIGVPVEPTPTPSPTVTATPTVTVTPTQTPYYEIPTPTPTPEVAGRLVVRRQTLKPRKRTIRIAASCPASATAGCKGVLDLVTAKAVRVRGTKAKVTLGAKRYAYAAGKARKLKIKLPRGYKSLAKRKAKRLAVNGLTRNTGAADGSARLAIRLR